MWYMYIPTLVLITSPAAILNSPYQFILSSIHNPSINLRWFPFILSSIHNPSINHRWFPFNFVSIPISSRTHSGGTLPNLSCGAVFTVCSHTFTLFWLRKTSEIIEMFQLSFHVFVCLSSGDLIFSVIVSSFFSYCYFIRTWVLSFQHCLYTSSLWSIFK